MLLPLVNLVAILGLLGVLFYTQVMFKRPKITETKERAALEAAATLKKKNPEPPLTIPFEPLRVNIQSSPGESRQGSGSLHIVALTFSIEIADGSRKVDIDAMKPVYVDQVITLLGKKTFDELASVQGRYLLRSEMIELANKTLGEAIVSNVFFGDFIVQ